MTGPMITAHAVTRTLAQLYRETGGHPPLPGRGETALRWATLADACSSDLAVGRLVEAHLDADAILAEFGHPRPGADEIWGVWAAESGHTRLTAHRRDGRWTLTGVKPWCSGADLCTHALITAVTEDADPHDPDARRLFAVDLAHPDVSVDVAGWTNAGMAATATGTITCVDVPAVQVARPGDYLRRPGFWHGGVGVAACWWAGARLVAAPLYASSRHDDITTMHLGAVDGQLCAGWAHLEAAARAIDDDPHHADLARHTAFAVRLHIEQVATAVIDRVSRACGPGPLVHDAAHAQAVADLTVYVRQSHADHDLVALGTLARTTGPLRAAHTRAVTRAISATNGAAR